MGRHAEPAEDQRSNSVGQVYRTQRRAQFRDTDLAGIVHFTVFFLYMEEAEHEFLRHLGMSVITHVGQRQLSWPRVAASCNYLAPLRFEETVTIELSIKRLGDTSVSYAFRFLRDDKLIANGEVTAVCCEFDPDRFPVATRIPDTVRQRLTPFVDAANHADS